MLCNVTEIFENHATFRQILAIIHSHHWSRDEVITYLAFVYGVFTTLCHYVLWGCRDEYEGLVNIFILPT